MIGAWMAEMIKFKRSRMNGLVAVGALLPAFLSFMIERNELGRTPRIAWDQLLQNNLMMMALLMAPALFALFTGYVYAREYQERVINCLYTAYRKRWVLLTAKLLALVPVMAATLALSFGLALAAGLLLPHEELTAGIVGRFAGGYALLLATQIALIPAGALVSLIGRSYIPSMALGVLAVISAFTIISSKYGDWYPWSAQVLLVIGAVNPDQKVHVLRAAISLAVAGMVPLAGCYWMAYRRDVHSG